MNECGASRQKRASHPNYGFVDQHAGTGIEICQILLQSLYESGTCVPFQIEYLCELFI